jgi:hypothetical protein
MGYYLYDANGYVGDLASNNGLTQMSKYVFSVTSSKPIHKLFEEGYSPVTDELITDFKAIYCNDKDIAITIENLIDLLSKCDTVAIISNGIT